MKISIITLFPEMFQGPFSYSIIKRAIDKKLVEIRFLNLRDFGVGPHKQVDDTPYGGGAGMILKVDVLEKAILHAVDKKIPRKNQRVILLTPEGEPFKQKIAKELSQIDHLILICGHYEGYDARIKNFVDMEISIGDFILTGGEIPAAIIVDSVVRLLPGAIKEGATDSESFSEGTGDLLEAGQFTKPREFKGLPVPEVLLSGNHQEIEKWKKEESLKITKSKRRDLLKS